MLRSGGVAALGSSGHKYSARCLASLPPLPPKFFKSMQDHADLAFVERRRQGLEAYLNGLLAPAAPHSLLTHLSPDLAAFLDIALFDDVFAVLQAKTTVAHDESFGGRAEPPVLAVPAPLVLPGK